MRKFFVSFLITVFAILSCFADSGSGSATLSSGTTANSSATAAVSSGSTGANTAVYNTVDPNVPVSYATSGALPLGSDYFNKDIITDNTDTVVFNPVLSDYLLKPNDQLIIDIWGQLDLHYILTLDNQSYITIPKVGHVALGGLTFKDAKEKILKALANSYSFYINPENPTAGKASVDISIGKTIGINVFVTGEVNRPTQVNVSSTNASILNALCAAKGISSLGSIRNIKIIRQNGTSTVFDLYDFLFKGKLEPQFKYLNSGDVVLVPVRTKIASVSGAVRRPGMYELLPTDTLKSSIELAGGTVANASKTDVQLFRRGATKQVLYVDITQTDTALIDQDNVVLHLQTMPQETYVYIDGKIKSPGQYKRIRNMTLKDLIITASGFLDDSLLDHIDVGRNIMDSDGKQKTIGITVDYNTATGKNFLLQPGDSVVIKQDPAFSSTGKFVTIMGEVKLPGLYAFVTNERISDLVKRAGGITKYAFINGSTFMRGGNVRVQIKMQEALKNPKSFYDFILRPNDLIIIPAEENFISVKGEVWNPQQILYRYDGDVEYYINNAGGYTDNADQNNVRVINPDGSINRNNGWWFGSRDILPGSTVVVPAKRETISATASIIQNQSK